jgi:hypothetical protein
MIGMMAAAVLMAGPWEKYTPAHPQGVRVLWPYAEPLLWSMDRRSHQPQRR